MNMIEWKEDPSKLNMFEDGESAIVDEWELHIDKLKKIENPLMHSFMRNLSDREKEVLEMGLDEEFKKKRELREKRERLYPYCWKVERKNNNDTYRFTHMGGRAESAEKAKEYAVMALEFAKETYNGMT